MRHPTRSDVGLPTRAMQQCHPQRQLQMHHQSFADEKPTITCIDGPGYIRATTTTAVYYTSGAGTNLNVGRGQVRRQVPGKFFCRVPPLFWLYKYTISRFGECFRDGQCSLVSFLFAVLLLTVPPCPMESAPLTILLCHTSTSRLFPVSESMG